MDKKKIVVGGGSNAESREFLTTFLKNEYENIEIVFVDLCSEKDFIESAKGAVAILSQYQPMTNEIYKALSPNLRIHASLGIGFNRADIDSATRNGVVVTNVPDYCIDEVACHTLALMLSFQRQLFNQIPRIKDGNWDIKSMLTTTRFKNSTIGLYGFGAIARNVALKLQGFGVKIIACDPYIDQAIASKFDVSLVSFNELLKNSDIISLHAPLLDATQGVFNESAFLKMKSTAILINCSRGELIARDDLYHALVNHTILGAALDVVWNDNNLDDMDKKIIQLPNVWATGHSAFYSVEALQELSQKAANEVGRALRSERPRCCVNKEVLSRIKWFKD